MSGAASLVLVVGPAGTGKTARPPTPCATSEPENRPVIGLAPSGKAADVLAIEAGCRTDTLAGFLTVHSPRTSVAVATGHHGHPRRGRHGQHR